jgi:hypothetical protein
MIHVRRAAEHDSPAFEVIVREGKGETRHYVTMSREMCERLTAGKHTPERYLEAAFRFLLDRELKESILRRFDVTAISRYFPEREMPQYLCSSDKDCEVGSASRPFEPRRARSTAMVGHHMIQLFRLRIASPEDGNEICWN